MPDVIADLEPQPDASTSSDAEVRFADDKSVDTGAVVEVVTEPVEVETETEEVTKEPESEADPSPADEENVEETIDPMPDDDPEYGAKVQARMDELTTFGRETERALEVANEEVAKLREQIAAVPVVQEPLKTPADFDFDDVKYQTYLMDENEKRATAAAERAVLNLQDRKTSEEQSAKFAEAESKYAEKHKDYFKVTRDPNLRISQAMLDAAGDTGIREDVLHHLGLNPDKALKMYGLPDAVAGGRVAALAAELKAEQAIAAKPKVVSDAPKPVPKIKSGDAGLDKGYVTGMTDTQYRKRREKEIANR